MDLKNGYGGKHSADWSGKAQEDDEASLERDLLRSEREEGLLGGCFQKEMKPKLVPQQTASFKDM